MHSMLLLMSHQPKIYPFLLLYFCIILFPCLDLLYGVQLWPVYLQDLNLNLGVNLDFDLVEKFICGVIIFHNFCLFL